MKVIKLIALLLLLSIGQVLRAQGTSKAAEIHIVNIVVTDKNTKESVIMANCSLDPLGSFNVTDIDGKAVFQKVPTGTFTLKVSYVGYETYTTTFKVEKDLTVNVQLVPTSLALKEVVVTAKQNASGLPRLLLSVVRQSITCRHHRWRISCSSFPVRRWGI